MNSGYSSRNSTQADVHKMSTGLSNKVPAHAGDNQRGANDFLRLKRANNNVMNSLMNATGNDSTVNAAHQK